MKTLCEHQKDVIILSRHRVLHVNSTKRLSAVKAYKSKVVTDAGSQCFSLCMLHRDKQRNSRTPPQFGLTKTTRPAQKPLALFQPACIFHSTATRGHCGPVPLPPTLSTTPHVLSPTHQLHAAVGGWLCSLAAGRLTIWPLRWLW